MALDLPDLLADYYAAENRSHTEGLGACFADHGVVRDEGRTIEGVAAIKQWMRQAKKKYQHTFEPVEVVERDGKTVVTAGSLGIVRIAQ
jgi:hypothetical protein